MGSPIEGCDTAGGNSQAELKSAATNIVRRLRNAGHEAFWVGGCVRDFLLGRIPGDYDIATSALPAEVEAVFNKTIPVGREFGVVIVVEKSCSIQVATFRAEADYTDGRHPDKVQFGHARADASRRDFTVNGLFYDPLENTTHDWVGGLADLKGRLIRTIGMPAERFAEDHLRLLRAIRFAAQLDFNIEPQTFAAIRKHAADVATVSAERIRDELLKLLAPANAARGLDLLVESGLLEHVLPEFVPCLTSEQSPEFHPEGNVFEHVRLMLRHLPANAHPLLPWAAILHDIGKPATFSQDPVQGTIHNYGHERVGAQITEEVLTRLRFPRKQTELLVHAVRCHMQFKDAFRMRKATLRRMLMRPTFPFELELHRIDCLGSHRHMDVYEFLLKETAELESQPEVIPPLVNGYDLLELGMSAGPEIGRVLTEIRDLQLEGALQTKEQALKWVRGNRLRKD